MGIIKSLKFKKDILHKKCPDGKVLNIKTNRCIKDPSLKKSLKKETVKRDTTLSKCENMSISLINMNNSCHLDSIIVALLHGGNNTIKDIFLKAPIVNYKNIVLSELGKQIKKELQKIDSTLLSYKTAVTYEKQHCTNLRILLQKYQDEYHKNVSKIDRIDWIKSQSEPLDFLRFINIIFKIQNNLLINRVSWGGVGGQKRMKKVDEIEKTINYIDIIDIDALIKGDVVLKEWYPKRVVNTIFNDDNLWRPQDKVYKERREQTVLLHAPLLVVHVNRNLGDNKLNSKVLPCPKIKMRDNTVYLRSIIIHDGGVVGGHYRCLYECSGIWFIYDDTKSKVKVIGGFNLVETWNNGYYLRNCTDIVYW